MLFQPRKSRQAQPGSLLKRKEEEFHWGRMTQEDRSRGQKDDPGGRRIWWRKEKDRQQERRKELYIIQQHFSKQRLTVRFEF